MSDIKDFVIENGVLKKYVGPGGDVVIPEGVTELSDNVFNYNVNKSNLEFQPIKNVTLPVGLRKIGNMAFWNCLYIQNVQVPEGVESIGENCFNSCYSLTQIHLPGSVHTIGKNAFNCCESLTAFSAPGVVVSGLPGTAIKELAVHDFMKTQERYTNSKVVESYYKYMFSQRKKWLPVIFSEDRVDLLCIFGDHKKITASNLNEDFLVPANNANATKCIAYLLDIANKIILPSKAITKVKSPLEKDIYNVTDMKKIWSFSELDDGTLSLTAYKGAEKVIIIPERIGNKKVTQLGVELFSPIKKRRTAAQTKIMKEIESVSVPNSITHMEDGVFSNCENLMEVILSDNILSIGEYTFCNCGKLSKVNFPRALYSIGNYAFFSCCNLTQINLPESLTKIGHSAFQNCRLLRFANLTSDIEIGSGAFQDCLAMADKDGFVIVNHILFSYHGKETHVVIPDGVQKLSGIIFYDAKQVREISIPDTVKEIEQFAFYGCKKIKLRVHTGSYAEKYAKENNIPFIAE